MCLMIEKAANVTFTEPWLRDFYLRNNDGYGFMYSEGGKLHIHKAVSTADGFVAAFKEREDKAMLIHLRMRTHGDIDLLNCHPYEVLSADEGGQMGALWMMHNGVLSQGNAADKTKSDTWHYINNVLRPLLLPDPTILRNLMVQKLIGSDISSGNRFGFMSSVGDTIIINKHTGVVWNGAWMSNTYAWDAEAAGLVKPSYQYYSQGYSDYTGYTSPTTTPVTSLYEEAEDIDSYLGTSNEVFNAATDFFWVLDKYGFTQASDELGFNVVVRAINLQPDEMKYIQDSIEGLELTSEADGDAITSWVSDLADAHVVQQQEAA